jgi:molecular chaperone GrpE
MNTHDPIHDPSTTPNPEGHGSHTAPAPAEALQQERDDLYERLLRKTAEFDNFRKRIERERKDFTEWAAADVLGDLLAVMDDFDRALTVETPEAARPYKVGVEMIHKALHDLVRKRGVTEVEALGQDFNPHHHQAVSYEEVAGARDGEVVQVLQQGYMLGERLLRPAMVRVAKVTS